MLVTEIITEKLVWAKSGNRAMRKYRCGAGSRKGRVVSSAAACFSPIDIKKRITLKKTKAKQRKRSTAKNAVVDLLSMLCEPALNAVSLQSMAQSHELSERRCIVLLERLYSLSGN